MLQSSVSGLQRLFSGASSSVSPHKLESCIEEAHTHSLLFPESVRHVDSAHITAAAGSADDRGGLDISQRDVRIIVAQDGSPTHKEILYDSDPPSIPVSQAWNGPSEAALRRPRAGSFGGLTGGALRSTNNQGSRTAPHSRQSSYNQPIQSGLTSPTSPLSPVREIGSLFSHYDGQGPSARPVTRDGETDALLRCMFGESSGLASTSSTKLHVRPPRPKPFIHDNRVSTATRDTVSPTAFPKRRTPLTRSTTASELQNENDAAQHTPRYDSSAIWITRLFSIDLKESAFGAHPSSESFRFRNTSRAQSGSVNPKSTENQKARQFKAPMYAIAMVLHMPSHRHRPPTPYTNRSSGSSATSPQRWQFDGSSGFSTPGLQQNGDVEYVLAHWSVIDRALSELEVIAISQIDNALLKANVQDLKSQDYESMRNPHSSVHIASRRPTQPMQCIVQLPAGALQGSRFVHGVTDRVRKRLALALKIHRVIAGQGRWDVWRHELRWVDKWANKREHNFFLFNLLSAYLAYHTEWLELLAPRQHRRQHTRRGKDGRKQTDSVANHRTVIVSLDKMGSRRLIFLLSAFLPGNNSTLVSDGSIQSDWLKVGLSESPRSSGQISREQHSWRATKRNGNISYTLAHEDSKSQERSMKHLASDNGLDAEKPFANQHTPLSSRRASTSSVALLITSSGSVTRKSSSTTTTATIKPESTVPIAHFANPNDNSSEFAEEPRPGSSGSLVPMLQRTLSRSESNDASTVSTDSNPGSVWGSVSRMWGSRRGSSTDPSASSGEGLGISGIPRSKPLLTHMVEELDRAKHQQRSKNHSETTDRRTAGQAPISLPQSLNSDFDGTSPLKQEHRKSDFEPLPLKLSVDEDDGIVDVDLPPASSHASSFGSLRSPLAIHTAASSFNDRSSHYGRPMSPVPRCPSPETAGEVAGWLRKFHPDFALQAVRPYDGLKEQIKNSMRTLPTPSPSNSDDGSIDEWSDVCSTLIADATNCTVTRLCLRRKNKISPHHRVNALLEHPNRDISHEEQFIEEPLMDMDPTLIDALEKVISHSGSSTRAPSPAGREHRTGTDSAGLGIHYTDCSKVILGALEQVARSVSAEMAAQDQRGKDVVRRGKGEDGDLPRANTLREGVRKWFREVDSHAI